MYRGFQGKEDTDRMSLEFIVAADAAFMAALGAGVWRAQRSRSPGSSRKALEKAFEHQLLHDDLTKLPNRTLFRDRLERALARSVRRRQSCAVLAIDVDRFKLVGEGLGPTAADRLLREVGARLDASLRPEDTVARTGGDEFMILLEAVGSVADATAVSDRVTAAVSPPFHVDGQELFLTTSIGIALGRGGRDRPEDVLQNADVAVHRAKEAGRARCEVFRQEMNPHPMERLGLETDLRRAVDRMEFLLEYQPCVDLSSGRIVSVEALVRWSHPERGILEPLEFVPVAEETGLVLPLGRWILDHACKQASGWSDSGPRLCVNVSARQLAQPRLRLADEVSSALGRAGLGADRLCLEITERAVMQDVDAAIVAMRDLDAVGVHLALDDFGTGYSSLARLRGFPLDVVKIDGSFVAGMDEPEGEAIVRALIQVCHALGARVQAEGVERPEQARTLKGMGCDLGQGTCFSPPLPGDEIDELVKSGRALQPNLTNG
jgi:diguanylate cyclase (GGDEF)-like protein